MAGSPLSQPRVRRELLSYLSELSASDPVEVWEAERQRGMVSGIDQVFHFFFDDHDFDETAVGVILFDENEVRLLSSLKRALEAVLSEVGDASDSDFTSHPRWPQVRHAAALATIEFAQISNDN